MIQILRETQIRQKLGGIQRRKWGRKWKTRIGPTLTWAEKLRLAFDLGYEQGHEQQMQMRIRDAQESSQAREHRTFVKEMPALESGGGQ